MKSHQEQLPLSGYAIVKVYATEQKFKPKEPSEDAGEHDGMHFGWDWRWVDAKVFEVRLTIAVEPAAGRRQYAETDVIGRFRVVADPLIPPVEEFVRLQAIAILLPYARQYLSALTSNSVDGAFYLPTINVSALMHGFDPEKATGTKQAADGTVPSNRTPVKTRAATKKR